MAEVIKIIFIVLVSMAAGALLMWVRLEPKIKRIGCIWTWDETHGYYDTSCDHAFTFSYSKKEAEFIYCPYCGKLIDERVESEVEDE